MSKATKPSILIIDDEPKALKVMTRALKNAGYRVTSAGSPDEARTLAKPGAQDLIVSDVNMPGLRGPELVKEFQASGIVCPMLLVSGEGSYEALHESLGVPHATFLPKPFSPDDLVRVVSELLAPR